MHFLVLALTAMLTLVIAGCGSDRTPADPTSTEVQKVITPPPPKEIKPILETDEFSGDKWVQLNLSEYKMLRGVALRSVDIYLTGRRSLDRDLISLYFYYSLYEWAFFDSAAANGRSYPFTGVDRIVGNSGPGSVQEQFQVSLPPEEFEELKQQGLKMQIRGRHGS